MTAAFLSALPWLVLVVLLVAYALADDLPAPPVRRFFLGVGGGLVAGTAVAVALGPDAEAAPHLLVSLGPLAFLLVHHLLRIVFRRWKGEEPTMVTAGKGSGAGGRFFFEVDAERRVGWRDYLYTFLLGVAMLVAAAPVIGVFVERWG